MRTLLTAVSVALLTAATVAVAAPSTAAPAAASAGYFHVITPRRAVDTRTTGTPVGPGGVLKVKLAKYVPSATANAVVLNVTVTEPTADGFLTVYPDGTARPLASSLNKRVGQTLSNSVTVALPANGSRIVDVYNQQGSSQVVVDVTGYYDPDSNAARATQTAYFPATSPTRAADTRGGGRLGPDDRLDVVTTPPSLFIQAVAVTITAVSPSGAGYLTAWNGRSAEPSTSTVNYGSDPVTANFAIVPVVQDDNGKLHFTLENHVARTDVVVDVDGFYAQAVPSGGLYLPVTPTRTVDTRTAGGPFAAGATRVLSTGTLDRDDAVTAVNLNLTAVNATAPTYLTAYAPTTTRPGVSNLNVSGPNSVISDAVQVGVQRVVGSSNVNVFDLYNFAGSVDVVTDVQGYFLYITSG